MTNPPTMLSFIQRILQSNSSRKRKRSHAFSTGHVTSPEIEDLRQAIADNEPLANAQDREQAIAEFLGTGGNGSLNAKRRKQSQGGGKGDGRLSTISERQEESLDDGPPNSDETVQKQGGSDEEMVNVELQEHQRRDGC